MISKELLSKVLGIEVFEVDSHVIESRFIGFYSRKNISERAFTEQTYHSKHACWLQHINIHELGNKCKEWLWDNGYSLEIDYIGKTDMYIGLINHTNGYTVFKETYYNNIEPEAIVQVCQRILDNKEKY